MARRRAVRFAILPAVQSTARHPIRTVLAVLLAGAGLLSGCGTTERSSTPAGTNTAAAGALVCNGSAALCGKRLDQIAVPATHNSYAASDEPGWHFANQRYGIARQLRDGIRGLLLDIHWGAPDARRNLVRTDFAAEGASRNKVAEALPRGALRTAERLAGRQGIGAATGTPSLYLCHTLCELGAEPLDAELATIKTFLDEHPGDVLDLVIEPYVPAAAVEGAFRKAGLLDQAVHLRRDAPLPTLGTLVRANTRLVVFTEHGGGTLPWYLPAFTFVQDTPYSARNLPCRRYRGEPDSPLFLINHWVARWPPSPRQNRAIGGDVLRDRLDRCAKERGLTPNLIAVDFYQRSGVVAIAAERNAADS